MRRLLGLLLALLLVAGAAAVAFLYSQVKAEAVRDETRPADALVVFGAAEYAGRPSPVLKSRLDHALALYRRGYARLIITTGGSGGDPHFTEAGVGRDYLVDHGVPPEYIVVEESSATTAQAVLSVAEVLLRNNMKTCIVVSDGYHLFRIKRELASRGIIAYGSPRPSAEPAPPWKNLRQVFGYLLWKAGIRV